jgi:hypothetical protein
VKKLKGKTRTEGDLNGEPNKKSSKEYQQHPVTYVEAIENDGRQSTKREIEKLDSGLLFASVPINCRASRTT